MGANMNVMKIGENYEFKNKQCQDTYRDAARINRHIVDAIVNAGGVFRIVEGEFQGDRMNKEGELVDDVRKSLTDVHGKQIYIDSGATLIAESEMRYFQVAVSVEINMDEAFAKTSFAKLMAIHKSYHPDAPDSKITAAGLRKSWDMHNLNIREIEEKIEILTKTLAQRKEML